MNNYELRKLAGLTTSAVMEKKLSAVKAKVVVPEGTFKKKAAAIVKAVMAEHDGDIAKAIKAVTFYINRAGKDLDPKEKEQCEKALAKLKDMVKTESINIVRRMSGLPLLEKKKDDMDMEMDAMDDEGEDKPVKDASKDEDEEDLPAIVKKIAKKSVGKDAEELEELLMKVYEAGHKDGMKAAKDEEKGGKKDKPSKENATKDDMPPEDME